MNRFLLWAATAMTAAACLGGCDVVSSKEYTMTATPTDIDDAIPLQQCVILVTVEDTEGYGLVTSTVKITATAPAAEVAVQHASIKPGEVAEVIVIPEELDDDDADREIAVTIHGTRGDLITTQTVTITIHPDGQDEIADKAEELRDLFIPWLAEKR